ncbi:hypothetical protein CDIK_4160 [Cucumispora dikerogammari]|nr:hypothetical protein CDIK_4160 [Cucumispora dikerogammari]
MLVLIVNLLSISSSCGCEGVELLNLRIINCEKDNGDLVDTGFLINKYTYKLKLTYNNQFWSISICLHIGIIPKATIAFDIISIELLKHTENIGKSVCNGDFVLCCDATKLINRRIDLNTIFDRDSIILVYSFEHKNKQSFFAHKSGVVSELQINKDFF